MKGKLVIVMVGLPARGKSTMARKLGRTLEMDGVRVRIFNNGELRRKLDTDFSTSSSEFFSPANVQGKEMRERISQLNIEEAQAFLQVGGEVAIIDASNVTRDLSNLCTAGFAERLDNGNYRLGPRLIQISLAHSHGLADIKARVEEIEQRYSRTPN